MYNSTFVGNTVVTGYEKNFLDTMVLKMISMCYCHGSSSFNQKSLHSSQQQYIVWSI